VFVQVREEMEREKEKEVQRVRDDMATIEELLKTKLREQCRKEYEEEMTNTVDTKVWRGYCGCQCMGGVTVDTKVWGVTVDTKVWGVTVDTTVWVGHRGYQGMFRGEDIACLSS
jgi:hypothetical protein